MAVMTEAHSWLSRRVCSRDISPGLRVAGGAGALAAAASGHCPAITAPSLHHLQVLGADILPFVYCAPSPRNEQAQKEGKVCADTLCIEDQDTVCDRQTASHRLHQRGDSLSGRPRASAKMPIKGFKPCGPGICWPCCQQPQRPTLA